MIFGAERLFLCALVLRAAVSVIIRDYNHVNFENLERYEDFVAKHIDPSDNTVKSNIFLGVATPECSDRLQSPALLGVQRHGGGGVLLAVTLPKSEFPVPFQDPENVCAQIYFYRASERLTVDEPTAVTTDFEHRALNSWFANQMRVTDLRITNNFGFRVAMYWHEESSSPVPSGELAPGESTFISSFFGHVFSANAIEHNDYYKEQIAKIKVSSSPSGSREEGAEADGYIGQQQGVDEQELHPGYQNLVDFFVVDGLDYTFRPENRIETCELVPGSTGDNSEAQASLNSIWMKDNLLSCDNMYTRIVDFTHNIWYDKRLGLNFVQPQLVRPVTEMGFENRRLPEATYAWLREWYLTEKLRIEKDEGNAGPCMNQHVSPSTMTHITPDYKDRLSAELQDILEEWYGGPLYCTSIYGIRKYVNGSVLRMHVDTVNTHVVSAIINVDQEVDKDWPLVILDHNDQEHRVNMRPGDMLLYESAKLLHGRPDTFVGKHYDNIFIHYKPTSGWDYSWI